MLNVVFHTNAQADLRAILAKNQVAGTALFALIRQMGSDRKLQNILLDHGGEYDGNDVKHWWEHYKVGKDLWRIRIREPWGNPAHQYRIIYGYRFGQGFDPCFVVLGIFERHVDYDSKSEIGRRILADFNSFVDG